MTKPIQDPEIKKLLEKDLLTPSECQKVLGGSLHRIYDLIKNKDLIVGKRRKTGRQWATRESVLEVYKYENP